MKKAVFVIGVALMAAVMLTTPVFAIGPWQAEEVGNNPNLDIVGGTLTLDHKNGLAVRFHDDSAYTGTNVYRGRDLTWYRPASKGDVEGEIKDAAIALMVWTGSPSFIATLQNDDSLALEYENKWIYMSNAYLRIYFGPYGEMFGELWPYGVYYRYVNIG